ncbi:phosphatidate cytidylyltransferase [Ectobacillus panaciterrae]|uniref:phosphatidate cytidylyltransferase n=1 Tax=Ectobacillus panaciterrae TaxID=363872 RepID=UPI0003F8375E|nr:phosphatidate cytidylyltransferase [Ectobacillus panaciterrae]
MKQRIITAVIAIALFIPIVLYGGAPFTIAIYVLASVGLYELVRMKKLPVLSVPTVLTAVLLWFILVPSDATNIFDAIRLTKVEVTFVIVLLLLSYTVLSKNTFTFDDASFLLMSTIYVAMGFFYLNETRIGRPELNGVEVDGLRILFYALFVIWATDSGAYFIGKAIGKHKLWPEISPNKTVEGSIGGIICAIAVAFVYNAFEPVSGSIAVLIGVTIAVSIFGQIGDLVESAFKRHYGVKDSGKILPGHGGILDRFDSLLFVLPLLHFLHFI